jgi:biopolymer transport protein ExbD/biopolymer transport protein TolR
MQRHRGRGGFHLNAEINVVSLIDVMMLLLVIFMLTAPMMSGGLDLTLPSADAQPIEAKSGLVVSIDRRGTIFVNDQAMSLDQFRASFRSIASRRTSKGADFQADSGVTWGQMAPVIAIINGAGIDEMGFVMNPEKPPE